MPPEHEMLAQTDGPDVPDAAPPDDGGDGGADYGGDDERHDWVTIATFWTAPEAHIARLRLESQAIPCAIIDENIVSTQWLWANAVGGIKLQVPAERAADASELLRSSLPAAGSDADDDGVRCPACGSTDVTVERFSRRLAFLSILLLGAPLPFLRRRCRCDTCGHTWRWHPLRPGRGFAVLQPQATQRDDS